MVLSIIIYINQGDKCTILGQTSLLDYTVLYVDYYIISTIKLRS